MHGEGHVLARRNLLNIAQSGNRRGPFLIALAAILAATQPSFISPTKSQHGAVGEENVRHAIGGGDIDSLAGNGNGNIRRGVSPNGLHSGDRSQLSIAGVAPSADCAIGKQNEVME